jgi:hypothetical protein
MSAFEIYKNQLYDLLADRDIRSGKDPSIKSGKRAKSDGISNVATAMMVSGNQFHEPVQEGEGHKMTPLLSTHLSQIPTIISLLA